METQKNIAQGFYEETVIEPGFFILKFYNETNDYQSFVREVSSDFVQFHFCIKGSSSFSFNEGNYVLPLKEDISLLLYNPQRTLPLNLTGILGYYRYYCLLRSSMDCFLRKQIILHF